jgi:glycosyltransferase involved in cell wall biosynthesis
MVIMEAMALGKPVLGSQIGGIPELIQHNLTGYILPCGNSSAFAETILYLIHDRKRRKIMGDEAAKWAETHFDYSIYSKSLWCVYSRLLRSLPHLERCGQEVSGRMGTVCEPGV